MIEATHWSNICAAVKAHAQTLYPRDKEKQQELTEKLLCITTEGSLQRRSRRADAAMVQLKKAIDDDRQSWWKKLLPF